MGRSFSTPRLTRRAVLTAAFGLAASLPTSESLASERAVSERGPARVLEVLSGIQSSLTSSRYSPITRVDTTAGSYEFDCSGMAAWVLSRGAPGAYQQVRRRSPTGRVVARDFVREIASIKGTKPSWGWKRVWTAEDVRPGDVIAWLKPPRWTSNITGHVGFVVEPVKPSERLAHGYLVRFADASRYHHQDDSRANSGRDGFGIGTILLITDPTSGAPVAYGWHGDESGWISETQIVIGRPRR